MSVPSLKRTRNLLSVLLAAAVATCGSVSAAEEPSATLRGDLEAVLKQRVADLLKEKDKDGIPIRRGAYSKNFRKVDDGTYQVTFHRDTVQTLLIDRDQMKVERFLVTLKRDGSKWTIADQKLEDSYDGLYRTQIDGNEAWRFDTFSFTRDGLKVTATNGVLYRFSLKGDPTGFRLVADDLAYAYAPPANMGFYGAAVSNYQYVFDQFVRQHGDDIRFKPERLRVDCDSKTCQQILDTAFTGLKKSGPIGGDGISSKLRSVYDEESKDNAKFQKESPFGGFERLPDPDNRYWRFSIKRAAIKDHALIVTYDNFDPREVAVSVTGYGFAPILTYSSEDVRASGISPYDLESRESEDARDYELKGISGSVDVALENPVELNGDITYTMNIKRDLRELPFYISRVRFPGASETETKNPKMFLNSIRDGDGNELTWVKLGASGGLVIFPESIRAGSEIKLRMDFTNLDSIYQLNPTYSAMDRGGWLPFVRFADMIDKFDLTVRTPARFEVLGIGGKAAETVKDGVRTTRWTSKSPVSFPTIIFGDYITDTSKHQATKIDGTPIPVNVWVDKTSTQGFGGESSDVGARDIRGKQLPAIATQAAVALDIYKEVYGVDYPFTKLDLVADPLGAFYGQAPASIIYLGFGVFRGEGTVASSGGGASISKFNKDVVAHEVGHQWWGSLICNANDGNYWFVESLAEVSSALYVERVFGMKRYIEKVADWRRNILETDVLSNVQDGYSVWGGGFGAPISNIYNKGPYAFHMLRQTFGDEKFFELLKALTTTLKGREIVTRDIQEIAEKTFGGTMEWFFNQWLRGIGLPQYAMNYTSRQTEDGKWLVEGTIKQRVIYGKDKVEMPGLYYRAVAPLTFVTHNGKKFKSKPLLVEGAETPFKLKVADEPAQVNFNEEGEILAHDVLVNRSW